MTYGQIPLSSANKDLQSVLSSKRRVIALNKKDLANPNIMHVSGFALIHYLVWADGMASFEVAIFTSVLMSLFPFQGF